MKYPTHFKFTEVVPRTVNSVQDSYTPVCNLGTTSLCLSEAKCEKLLG